MKHLLTFMMLALGFSSLRAADPVLAVTEDRFRGKTYVSELLESHLEKAPKWEAQTNAPPLLPKRAGAIAATYAGIYFAAEHPKRPADFPGWQPHRLSLELGEGANLWYYRISVAPNVAGTGASETVAILVTMDGKVVPLRVEEPQK